MDDIIQVGQFQVPSNQRVLLIAKSATFSDAIVHRTEGGVLFFEARNNVGKRRLFQILVDDLVGLEYEP